MRQLEYLINDVREATDNMDINGVKDREIIRYFNDGIKAIQALIFKNNPLCSYFQSSTVYSSATGREYTLPSSCYADNAVSMVETKSGELWSAIERAWPEDNLFGWFTRNKKIIITGDELKPFPDSLRVSYFTRLPRFDKVWAKVVSVAGQTVTVSNVDEGFSRADNKISIFSSDLVSKLQGAEYVSHTSTTITFKAGVVLTGVVAGDLLSLGSSTTLTLDLPEECEPYLLDYVAKRVFARNNYTSDIAKLEYFTEEGKNNIISIFGDAGQAITRTPITDTDYLRL